MSAERTRLSIDLGTLRTSAALQQGDAEPVMVSLGTGSSVPSTVAVDGGRVVIGDAAEAVLAAHPDRGVRELKRRFGDTTPVVLDGQAYMADALTAEVIAAVAAQAGVDPANTSLVLSHPVGWHEYKRDLLAAAGSRAGFADVSTLSEAEAAVRPFVRSGRLGAGATVAVYDLGGTFEASVVGITDHGAKVLGQPQSLERLGGDVLDQVVFRHVTEALGGTLQQLDRNDPAVRAAITALRAECAAAKERLSVDGETSVAVVAPGLDTRVRITRDEFETAVRPLVNDTLTALDRALASAGISATDLAAVVLAGGGSHVPVVAEMVAGHVGRPLLVDRPAAAVALGAAATLAAVAGAAVAVAAAPDSPASSDHPSSTDTSSPSVVSATREPAMSDQPSTEPTAPAAGGAGARSIPTPPPPPGKKVSSKVTTAAGGLAAVAAAITAAVFYGDDVVDAFDGPNGDANAAGIAEAPAPETRTADRAEREAGDDSMDAFDTVDAPAAAPLDAPAAGAAVGTPLAPPAPEQASFARPAPQPTHQQRPQFDDDGPSPAPRSAPIAPAAAAGAAAASAAAGAAGTAGTDSGFEAARAQLLARLDAFEAPEGTSPEDAQALKDELRDTIESFDPRPGQSTADAMADLRDEFDETVHDFTQDQQIEALIEETQRDNEEEAAAAATPADPMVPAPDEPAADDTGTDDTGTDDDGTVGDSVGEPPVVVADPADEPVPAEDGEPDEDTGEDAADETDGGDGVVLDPGFARVDPDLVDQLGVDPSVLAEVGPDGPAARLADSDLVGVDGESMDRDHRDEIDVALAEPDVQVRPEVRPGRADVDPTIGDAPVAEDPDAGGEITSRFDDGFDDLIQTAVISDPDDGGEATPGSVVGGDAVPQVRATFEPGADRPTMMTDLGDDTYQQVQAAVEIDASAVQDAVLQPVPDTPPVVDAPLVADAVEAPLDLTVPPMPEPEPIVLDDLPISATDDSDFSEDAPGFAEDLHSDITPDAPDNLNFGG